MEEQFNDGDIVVIQSLDENNNGMINIAISIFKTKINEFVYTYAYLNTNTDKIHTFLDNNAHISDYRITMHLATYEEKRLLFRKLACQKQLSWDNKNKTFNKSQWRACDGNPYYVVTSQGELWKMCEGMNYIEDDKYYNYGNYFKTKKLANVALNKFKQILWKNE